MSSRRLVPGDVIVVLQGRATCDMVLLWGSCLVEESMLSGEVCTHIQFTQCSIAFSDDRPSVQGYPNDCHSC